MSVVFGSLDVLHEVLMSRWKIILEYLRLKRILLHQQECVSYTMYSVVRRHRGTYGLLLLLNADDIQLVLQFEQLPLETELVPRRQLGDAHGPNRQIRLLTGASSDEMRLTQLRERQTSVE